MLKRAETTPKSAQKPCIRSLKGKLARYYSGPYVLENLQTEKSEKCVKHNKNLAMHQVVHVSLKPTMGKITRLFLKVVL